MTIVGGIIGYSTGGSGGTPPTPTTAAKTIEEKGIICTSSELVNDVVYVSGANTVSRASALNIGNARGSIGFIKSKESSVSCTVIFFGLLGGFTGLVPGRVYFISSVAGQISDAPHLITGTGKVLVKVGVAWDANTLFVDVSKDYDVRA